MTTFYLGQPLLPPGNLPFTACLALGTLGLKLIRKRLLSGLLSLGLVDTLHEHPLVFEHVSLNLHVHVMVHVLVNFLGFTVLAQQALKNTHPPHPQNLGGEPSLPRTPALTCRDIGLTYIYMISTMYKCQVNIYRTWQMDKSVQYTISRMTSLLLGLMRPPCTGPGVDLLRLPDDKTILNQLADILACKFCKRHGHT